MWTIKLKWTVLSRSGISKLFYSFFSRSVPFMSLDSPLWSRRTSPRGKVFTPSSFQNDRPLSQQCLGHDLGIPGLSVIIARCIKIFHSGTEFVLIKGLLEKFSSELWSNQYSRFWKLFSSPHLELSIKVIRAAFLAVKSPSTLFGFKFHSFPSGTSRILHARPRRSVGTCIRAQVTAIVRLIDQASLFGEPWLLA